MVFWFQLLDTSSFEKYYFIVVELEFNIEQRKKFIMYALNKSCMVILFKGGEKGLLFLFGHLFKLPLFFKKHGRTTPPHPLKNSG